MARMPSPANIAALEQREGEARENGDAVVALLPGNGDMRKAERTELELRELAFDAFDLLQAEHVRLFASREAAHEVEP